MGTYNLTCGISQTPIKTGDQAYFILLKETFGRNYCYSNEQYSPISFPIPCSYDEEEYLDFQCSEEYMQHIINTVNKGVLQYKSKINEVELLSDLNDLLSTKQHFVYYDAYHDQSYNNTKKEKSISYMVVHKSIFDKMSSYETYFMRNKTKEYNTILENLHSNFQEVVNLINDGINVWIDNPEISYKDAEIKIKELSSWKAEYEHLNLTNIRILCLIKEKNEFDFNNLSPDDLLTLSQIFEFYFPEVYKIDPKMQFERFTPLALNSSMSHFGLGYFIKNICLKYNKEYADNYLKMMNFDEAMNAISKQYLPQVTSNEEVYDDDLAELISKEAYKIAKIQKEKYYEE
jgi:hypothetical protein